MSERVEIPKEEFQHRLDRTQALMKERDLDGLLIFSSYQERDGHLAYLTNHRNAFPNVLSHMGMGHSALVLPADESATLVAPLGYEANKVVNVDGAKTGYTLVGEVADLMMSPAAVSAH